MRFIQSFPCLLGACRLENGTDGSRVDPQVGVKLVTVVSAAKESYVTI